MKATFSIATLLFITSICLTSLTAHADEAVVDATVVDEEAIIGDAIRGQALYSNTCKLCHTLTYDDSAVGAPGLQGVLERHDAAWLDTWIKGPEAFAKVNVTAKDLITSNPFGLIMPTLPSMQDDQKRADMIEFLKTLK